MKLRLSEGLLAEGSESILEARARLLEPIPYEGLQCSASMQSKEVIWSCPRVNIPDFVDSLWDPYLLGGVDGGGKGGWEECWK